MEKKHGFFTSLKEEVVRGLSLARSGAKSPVRSSSPMAGLLLPWWQKAGSGCHHLLAHLPEPLITRSGSFWPVGEALALLMEGPDPDAMADGSGESQREGGWGHWVWGQLSHAPFVSYGTGSGGASSSYHRRSNLRLLLSIMGALLAPIHVSFADPLPTSASKTPPSRAPSISSIFTFPPHLLHYIFTLLDKTSSAQYTLLQCTAASGGLKLQSSIHNAYAKGMVRMVTLEFETATKVMKNRGSSRAMESGGFILWQMAPDMWYVELTIGGSKIHVGSNGKLVWRHTPWLGTRAPSAPSAEPSRYRTPTN
ncbi:hypothetical protein COCNU_14G009300 [Cocos nucifera]|uniref:Uncharacterized protein n=1 Tax=Cocos nucifera TaxID=13894 RepID=A0A8K0IVF7_COCNU|nr:hypothetical protein COCNU_14G009300 [Cocos nucifera]